LGDFLKRIETTISWNGVETNRCRVLGRPPLEFSDAIPAGSAKLLRLAPQPLRAASRFPARHGIEVHLIATKEKTR